MTLSETSLLHRMRLGFIGFLAAASLANAAVMLFGTEFWYWSTPGVPDTGPYNRHFVRDIGLTFALIGACFAGGLYYQSLRVPLLAVGSGWLVLHALLHLVEVATGCLSPASLIVDTPAIFVPAVLSALVTFNLYSEQKGGRYGLA